MKKHLITGISGQDGLFLTKIIKDNEPDAKILGISRQKNTSFIFKQLNSIKIANIENIKIMDYDLQDEDSVFRFINEFNPDCVYNLSGPSSPSESITNPKKYNLVNLIFENLINSLIKSNNFPRFFQASSSEMFKKSNQSLNENSLFETKSPYSKSKLKNHKRVFQLHNEFGWEIYSGIMFNHESEFRKDGYLFKKVINFASEASKSKRGSLKIGSLNYIRDWSFAGDICEAIYKLTNYGTERSYVLGSGVGHSIRDLVEIVFNNYDLPIEEFISIDDTLLRQGDAESIIADPTKAKLELDWSTKLSFENLIIRCINSWS